MPNCPVCTAEYTEGQVTCPSCCWLLDVDFQQITEQINWAKQVWSDKSYFESESKKLEKDCEELKNKYEQLLDSKKSEPKINSLEEQLRKTIERVDQLEIFEKQYEPLNSQLEALNSQFKELTLKRESEEKEISQLKEERSQFQELETKLQNVQEERSQTQKQLSKVETRLEELEENLRANERINSGSTQTSSSARYNPSTTQDINPSQGQFQPSQAEHRLSLDESKLAQKYNRNLGALSEQAIEVNATEESISNLRGGSSSTVIFEKKRRGNYWILKEGGCEYLVPSNYLRINQHNYKTVEVLFECWGFESESSGDFQLFKPAKVSALSGGETWQLEENGILQF